MKVPGKRIKIPRWIHTDACVVKVEVEAVIPDADPREPCLEAETLRWMSQVRSHAERGDIEWLRRIGQVYLKQPA